MTAETWTCPECGATSADPTGWHRAQIVLTRYLFGPPNVAVSGDDALVVFDFDRGACRDAWCAKAGLTPPPFPEPA